MNSEQSNGGNKRIDNAQIKQAIEGSIAHWERMLYYAQRQIQAGRVNRCPHPQEMQVVLGEMWGGDDCPLCELFSDSCVRCPLSQGMSTGSCCVEWRSVERADTWGEWVEAAHKMLALLEKIRDKEEKRNELHR